MKLRMWRQKSKRALNTIITSAFLATQLLVPIATITKVSADPPGNNGTFQIHEKGEQDFKRSNDPHVCVFNFEAFGLDAGQTGNVHVTNQSPTEPKDAEVLTVPLSTDASGNGNTTPYVNDTGSQYNLPNGHYKATLDNKFGEDPGRKAKSKVFWVDCPKVKPVIETTASSSSVQVGDKVHDTATLTGDTQHGAVTGTVDFYLCGPSASYPDCSNGGTKITDKASIANGQAVSSDFTVIQAGKYCFRASYHAASGSQYLDATHTNKTTECFTATSAPTKIAVPAAPTPNDPCGFNNASWTQPADTDKITWTISNGHLIATTKTGYVFTDGTTTHDYGVAPDSNQPCDIPVPPKPGVNDPCGKYNATWIVPSDTDKITWNLDNYGNLTATAKAGYVFSDGKTVVSYGKAYDSNKACPGSLTIVKDARPDSSKVFWFGTNAQRDDFSLFDNGSGSGNSKTFADLKEGWYFVDEHDANGWTLKDITCSDGAFYYRLGDKLVVYLKDGNSVTCTFVNSRDTGKIKVIKNLVPASDSGRFNLNIDGYAKATNVGDNGTTGWVTVETGDHSVSESAANDQTHLSNYKTFYTCVYDDGWSIWHPWGHKPVSGYGTSLVRLDIGKDDKVTCTFTNKRIPHITIVKDARPDSSQAFTFDTNAQRDSFSLTDDGSNTGTEQKNFTVHGDSYYYFREDQNQDWNLSDISCDSGKWFVHDGKLWVKAQYGDNVTCTFVNVQKIYVTPGVPTFTQLTCEDQIGHYTIPDTQGVVYKVNGVTTAPGTYDAAAGTTVTITAEPAQGNYFPSDTTSSWSETFLAAEDCALGETDVCPNVKGDQSTVPDGMTKDLATGNCVTTGKGGDVLGDNTLVNTGESTWTGIMAGILAISAALGLTIASRKQFER